MTVEPAVEQLKAGVASGWDSATVPAMENSSPMKSGVVYRSMEDDGAGCPKVGDGRDQLGVRTGQPGKGSDFKRPGPTATPNGEGLSVIPHQVENMIKLRLPPAIVPRKLVDWGTSVLPVFRLEVVQLPESLQTIVYPKPVDPKQPNGEKVEKGIIQARIEMPIATYQGELASTKKDWVQVPL